MMIRKCNLRGKPVVTATQMLDSMITNPRPTRAECTDVANAVLDGTDCVMLSGETAGGLYPLQAVEMMANICVEAESVTNYSQLYSAMRVSTRKELPDSMGTSESIASSAVKTAIDLGCNAIIVCTETGNTARLVAKYRPEAHILVLTATDWVARQTEGVLRGTVSLQMGSMIGTEGILLRSVETLREWGWVESGDTVVAIHGMIEARPGSTNLCKVLPVP
jgi:pyruvate kinase